MRWNQIFCFSFLTLLVITGCSTPSGSSVAYDVIIRGGTVYDGTGGPGTNADVGIRGDRVVHIRDLKGAQAETEIDASGLAVSPGFINYLSWSTESLIADGRSQGEIRQGVTTQIMGEGSSMGPLTEAMKKANKQRQILVTFDYEWTTLAEYLQWLQKRGVSQNVASFIGATTVRIHVLGHEDRAPSTAELNEMRALVRAAMEEGALGVASSLVYAPAFYASTDELNALCEVVAEYDGLYATHLRSEGNQFLEAIDELLTINKRSGVRSHIYHLKAMGRDNWHKLDAALQKVEAARAEKRDVTADIYTYTAAATGLVACLPPWALESGYDELWKRLSDPKTRARIAAEVRTGGSDWENFYRAAHNPENILIVRCQQQRNRVLHGQTLAAIAAARNQDPVDTIIDLLLDDRSRIGAVYFVMSEENLSRKLQVDWVSFCSDGASMATESPFLKISTHPRSYGSFARLLGKYVREKNIVPLSDAIHRLTDLPARTLRLTDRGRLEPGYYADVVVFDPNTIADRATFADPHQYAVGVFHVWVNGVQVLRDGEHTGALPGRALWGPGKKERCK